MAYQGDGLLSITVILRSALTVHVFQDRLPYVGPTVNEWRQLATGDSIMRIWSVVCVILSNERETPYKHGA